MNAISTVISTKVFTPRKAVIVAAFFNFIAASVMGGSIASTIILIVNLDRVAAAIIPHIIFGPCWQRLPGISSPGIWHFPHYRRMRLS